MEYPVQHLPKEKWEGFILTINYDSYEFYDADISTSNGVFSAVFTKKHTDSPIICRSANYDYPDSLYQPHWEKADAFGVLDSEDLLGAIEICPEEWSNRLTITELWVREDSRGKGIGKALMNFAKSKAIADGNRAIILETQSCNVNAIGFYLHEGFEMIGFDSCCYTNADLKRREVRIDLGWFPENWKGVDKRRQ